MSVPDKKKILIRAACDEDLPRILELEQSCFPAPWREAMYKVEITRPEAVFLAADRNGELAGYLCGWILFDEGHILKIAVDPAIRRCGLGTDMMAAFEERCDERQVKVIWLEVREKNLEAMEFYRSLGFNREGVRTAYYSDTGEDAILMAKYKSRAGELREEN